MLIVYGFSLYYVIVAVAIVDNKKHFISYSHTSKHKVTWIAGVLEEYGQKGRIYASRSKG